MRARQTDPSFKALDLFSAGSLHLYPLGGDHSYLLILQEFLQILFLSCPTLTLTSPPPPPPSFTDPFNTPFLPTQTSMSYYDPQAWQLPGQMRDMREPSWEQQSTPSRSGMFPLHNVDKARVVDRGIEAGSAMQGGDAAFHSQIEGLFHNICLSTDS